jgi:hypothetical protein
MEPGKIAGKMPRHERSLFLWMTRVLDFSEYGK